MVRAQMAGFVFYAFYAHNENTYKYSHFQQKKTDNNAFGRYALITHHALHSVKVESQASVLFQSS